MRAEFTHRDEVVGIKKEYGSAGGGGQPGEAGLEQALVGLAEKLIEEKRVNPYCLAFIECWGRAS